jgi:1,4-alpha-glucan branching enzyme
MPRTPITFRVAQTLFIAIAASSALGQVDGNVQWDRISHSAMLDRNPTCPVDGQAFTVTFQTAKYDLSSCRVGVDVGADGLGIQWIDAQWQANRGEVDVWQATIPATVGSTIVAYVIELIDGADRDYLGVSGVVDDIPPVSQWWMLNFQTLSHAPLGATPVTGGTVFRVWAPGAASAHVRGDFNGWSLANPMVRLEEDFIARINGTATGQNYKYYFNNSLWKPDPRARFLNNAQSYNARITNPRGYQWRNPWFSPAPAEEWVVYQLHIGSFAGRNDPYGPTNPVSMFRDVTARIPHLAELGINAVMLNPINEFPGDRSGGYNPISMFAFESSYGTPDELKAMIDALHGAGIAVILDTTWNHFTSSDNFLWQFDGSQHYFDTPAANTPWGPQADVDRPQVLTYFLDSVEIVMGEFQMDGYRHDAIYELVSASQWAGGQNLIRTSMANIRRRFPDSHVIGEVYNNSAWDTSPGGIDLDGQYHEAFKNAVKDAIDSAAFGDPDMWRLANAIDGSGPWVEGDRVFNYFELHDEAWPLSGPGRTRAVKRFDTTFPHDDRYALGRTKLANGLTILAQGLPAILMGTEWAEDADWEFQKIDWSKRQTYAGVFAFYRDMIALRTSKRALFANSPARVFHVNDPVNVLAFERSGWDGRSYVVVANFSNTDYAEYIVGLPRSGAWGQILNSEDAVYRGRGVGGGPRPLIVESQPRDGFGQSVRLRLPAHGLLLLQADPEYISALHPLDVDRDGRFDIEDLYTITQSPVDVNGDGASDANDAAYVARFLREGELQDMTNGRR